ncbi:DUF1801 domain-containing protein [Hyalangium rubrum]|uniref:DUF1801 domain-containing protein n=1 Tax=Hyalangium rubrum TaxID=3103134 RepID=A0ABU5HGT5_9BACT|nr:DUF1801 domain-containing protein [Hyalangium sp. s54d21]MDY7232670.1 DUF1801 domain-containing protein [Hyalangium sp. s54d21]
MKKAIAAANPTAYVAALSGWQHACVTKLRAAVRAAGRAAGPLDEVIKWGHLVYLAQGPVLLIRAEPTRVLLGFWHGKRLRDLEPRLRPGGKYEMATLELREGDAMSKASVQRLTEAALQLNATLGDPTQAVRAR